MREKCLIKEKRDDSCLEVLISFLGKARAQNNMSIFRGFHLEMFMIADLSLKSK